MRKMQPVLSWNMASSFPDCLKRKEEKLPEQNTGHPCLKVMMVFCISTNSVNGNKSYKEKKMQYRSGAQDNTFLHELGHHIDALLEPKAYSMVEHQWNMEKVNRELI